jgi:putative transposase
MAHGEALRIRVIKAVVDDGLSRNEAARIFRVGIASAIRWVNAFEETRRTAPLPTGGDRRSVLKPYRGVAAGAAAQGKRPDARCDRRAPASHARRRSRQIDAVALLRRREDQL